ncbi:transcriptional regulator [Psychrobacillus sp. INOP01]|uniref:transcriptional regulator n=1 Tax=Psychrobacillus sp. INOP01 TaxID=2829187 RepID=UPI001BA61D29|nr:transcriptional regulator [Psychrobacillus sp. INOP01]QUG42759.1 transcriptional regulator [Psychrobacillus sp. INOP01]
MIHIAAVSSKEAIDQIIRNSNKLKDVKITPYIYADPSKSREVVESIVDCDVVIFAGPLPYLVCKDILEERGWQAVFIPLDEYTLTSTLFYSMIHQEKGIKRLSIDVGSALYVDHVVEEFNLSRDDWYVFDSGEMINDSPESFNVEKVIDHHLQLWNSGKIDFIITSVDYVYSMLREKGIPSVPMNVPEKAVVDTIHKAITYGRLAISKNAEIAIGLVTFSLSDNAIHEFDTMEQNTTIFLHQMMLNFARKHDYSLRLIGMDQFILYGTRGSLDKFIEKENLEEFFHQVEKSYGISMNIGFGLGYSARIAEGNARIALYHARKKAEQRHSIYIVSENQEIINPLQGKDKVYSLKSEDDYILSIASATRMSVSTITKLVRFEALRRSTSFTTIDLEEYLGISRRSAERILKSLIECNYVKKVGEEQPHSKGRPRSVYRISFD